MQIIALDTATPQLRTPPSGSTYSAPRAIVMTPETLTGSSATSSLSIAQTWNTTGTPTAIDLNVTDTASNAASLLMNLRVGGTSRFYFTKDGAIAFGSDADSYLKAASADGRTVDWIRDNVIIMRLGAVCGFATSIGIGTNGASQDVILARDAANTLALRNGTNAQGFNLYNTFTDASNYERGFVRWSSNLLEIGAEAAGTGTARDVRFRAGTQQWTFAANGNTTFPSASLTVAGSFTITRASGIFGLANESVTSGATFEMREQTAPAAPAADRVRIYAEDNGSGKTRLMALFATGAAQQIAIEP